MLLNTLNPREGTLVGHSTDDDEIARYVARHGTEQVSKVVLIEASLPLLVRTQSNPNGLPVKIFDAHRHVATDRELFFRDFALRFYGLHQPAARHDQALIEDFLGP
jgi:non-heme chloroperoxidase